MKGAIMRLSLLDCGVVYCDILCVQIINFSNFFVFCSMYFGFCVVY